MPSFEVYDENGVLIEIIRAVDEASAIAAAQADTAVMVDDDAAKNKRDLADRVNVKRAEIIAAGFMFNLENYGPVGLQGRPEDQGTLQGLAFAAKLQLEQGDVTPLTFLDRENVQHSFSPVQMLTVWQAGATFISDIYAASWVIKEMDPLTTDIHDPTLWGL